MGVHKVDAYKTIQLKVRLIGGGISEGPRHGMPSSAYLRRFADVTRLCLFFCFLKLFITHPVNAWSLRRHVFGLGPAIVELLLLGVSSSSNFVAVERFRALAGRDVDMSVALTAYLSTFADQVGPVVHKTLSLWNDGGVPRRWVVVAYSLAAFKFRFGAA